MSADAKERGTAALARRDWETAIEELGQAVAADPDDIEAARKLAQAEIDSGSVQEAMIRLSRLQQDLDEDHPEYTEVLGLLGRAYKQRFMNWPAELRPSQLDDLERAIAYYEAAYTRPEAYWVGLNVAILRSIWKAYGPAADAPFSKEEEAALRAQLDDALEGEDDYWGVASKATLYALDDRPDEAEALLAARDDEDAFKIGSTWRTITEIRDSLGLASLDPVIELLWEQLDQSEGQRIEVQAATEPRSPDPGRRPADRTQGGIPLADWEILRGLYDLVISIESRNGGDWIASGVLIAPDLVLTNCHALPTAERAGQARARFKHFGGRRGLATFTVAFDPAKVFATGNDFAQKDWTVVSLQRPVDEFEPAVISREPVGENEPLRLFHHPRGAEVRFVFENCRVLDTGPPLFTYTAATSKGSSGSPVFNHCSQLVGIHRAGEKGLDPTYRRFPVVEGVNIGPVLDALPEAVRGRLNVVG